jgi:hypothetical protein
MVQYEGTLTSSKQLLVSITPVTGVGILVDDFIAPIAFASGLSFGGQATSTGSNGSVGSNCAMPPRMWTALSHSLDRAYFEGALAGGTKPFMRKYSTICP